MSWEIDKPGVRWNSETMWFQINEILRGWITLSKLLVIDLHMIDQKPVNSGQGSSFSTVQKGECSLVVGHLNFALVTIYIFMLNPKTDRHVHGGKTLV